MYPLLCPGGYGVPFKKGKFRIMKITAVTKVDDINAISRLQLCDTPRNLPNSKTPTEKIVIDLKGEAVDDATLEFECKEPIIVRDTLYPMIATNLEPGSTLVYTK